MNILWFLFFVANILSFSQSIKIEDARLVFAHVIFRHGDRNPCRTYATDPWKDEKYWPEGFGQLTKLGMQQEYELGQCLRRRYETLLPVNIYPNKIVYVQSTDSDRTLMSAASLLAGLFPPSKYELWNENIAWQPIPIHTIPSDMDYVLAGGKRCERFEFLLKKHFNSPEFNEWRSKYKWFYEFVEKNSGVPMNNFKRIIGIHDTLKVQQLHHKSIPEWASKIYDVLTYIVNIEEKRLIGTREMSRLKSGFLLQEIVQRLNSKIEGTLQPNRTLWMYAAHDRTLANLLNLLDLRASKLPLPPYAASLLLELYQHNQQYFVQIIYKISNDAFLPPLDIPGCGIFCPVEKFYEIYKDFIPTDFETECKLDIE